MIKKNKKTLPISTEGYLKGYGSNPPLSTGDSKIPRGCPKPWVVIPYLVSLILRDPLLKSVYGFNVFWCNMQPWMRICVLFVSSTHKLKAFSTLTKHLLPTVALTFVVSGVTAKLAQIFFLLHNFTNRRFIFTVDLSNLIIHFFFFPYWKLSPFHLKAALYGFSLEYPNCQYYYSCALRPLSKIRAHLNTSTAILWQSIW